MKAADTIESQVGAAGGATTANDEVADKRGGLASRVALITTHHHLPPCKKGAA